MDIKYSKLPKFLPKKKKKLNTITVHTSRH